MHIPTLSRTPTSTPGELWSDEELEPSVTLDGVVTVVDAANVARQLADARAGGAPNEAQLQVAMADVVLVNKVGGWARDDVTMTS
jgi:G3E family GTPase